MLKKKKKRKRRVDAEKSERIRSECFHQAMSTRERGIWSSKGADWFWLRNGSVSVTGILKLTRKDFFFFIFFYLFLFGRGGGSTLWELLIGYVFRIVSSIFQALSLFLFIFLYKKKKEKKKPCGILSTGTWKCIEKEDFL